MTLWKRLLTWFKVPSPSSRKKWDPVSNPADIQRIAQQLRLAEKGADMGAAGIPSATQTDLGGAEREAVVAVEQVRADYAYFGQLRRKALDEQLNRLDITEVLTQASGAAEEFERLANNDITSNQGTLDGLRSVAESRQREFKAFRIKHGLEGRLPDYPTGLRLTALWTIAIALIAVEAVFNTGLFAKGLRGGLLEGLFEAAIAATLNVVLGLTIGGFFARHVNHRRTSIKIPFTIVTVLTLCMMVAFALMVAHYREALIHASANPSAIAKATFLTDTLDLELMSWVLFGASLFFGTAAAFDGFKMNDPYPGYKRIHTKMQQAVNAYNNAIESLNGHLDQLKQQSLAKVDGAKKNSSTSLQLFRDTIGQKISTSEILAVAMNSTPSMLAALLGIYREANEKSRPSGSIRPPSFTVVPELSAVDLPEFDVEQDRKRLRSQEELYARFIHDEPSIRARIQAAFTAKFSSLTTLAEHFDIDLADRVEQRRPAIENKFMASAVDGA